MKDNIERIFKESLENYSVPYDAAAWTSISGKLDAAQSTPFYKKWWFAASVVAVAGASSLLLLNEAPVEGRTEIAAKADAPQISATENAAGTALTGISSANGNISGIASETEINEGIQSAAVPVSVVQPTISGIIQQVATPADNTGSHYIAPFSGGSAGSGPTSAQFLPLNLPSTVCLNEQLEISNPNKSELIFVIHPNGKTTGVKPMGKTSFAASMPGTYQIVSGNHTDLVKVNQPENDIAIIQTSNEPFENGVPNMTFEVQGAVKNVNWSTNVSSSSTSGNTFIVHPFRENSIDVSVNTADANGCPVLVRKKFDYSKTYNLLAPNAISLSSASEVKRTFMPEALKIRDIAFEMVVLDAKTQSIVYKTTDASQPWDGTGINGEMAVVGTTWIWKAVVKNPLPGEPRVYSGTIVVVE